MPRSRKTILQGSRAKLAHRQPPFSNHDLTHFPAFFRGQIGLKWKIGRGSSISPSECSMISPMLLLIKANRLASFLEVASTLQTWQIYHETWFLTTIEIRDLLMAGFILHHFLFNSVQAFMRKMYSRVRSKIYTKKLGLMQHSPQRGVALKQSPFPFYFPW